MSRLLLVIAASALLFSASACDDSGTGSMVVHDMAMVLHPDMALGMLSCNAVLSCYQNCMDQTCIDDCYARDTAKAKMLDDDLFYGCPVRTCAKVQDGGAIPCTSAEVTGVMGDPNFNVSQMCSDCMANVDIQTSCTTELAACMADK
jgi:hypothetical protein